MSMPIEKSQHKNEKNVVNIFIKLLPSENKKSSTFCLNDDKFVLSILDICLSSNEA